MSCERYRAELTGVAAGQPLSAATSAHLEACPSCRAELAALRRALAFADDTLGEIAGAEPSPALRARIRQAAADAAAVGEPRPWRWAWVVAAAALVTAVGITALWRAGRMATPRAQSLAGLASPSPSSPPIAATREGESVGPEVTPAGRASALGLRSVATAVRRGVSAPRRRPAEPEVLVPRGGEEALMRFVALVHERKASPPALVAAGLASPDLPALADIKIKPLEIVPLDPAETPGT